MTDSSFDRKILLLMNAVADVDVADESVRVQEMYKETEIVSCFTLLFRILMVTNQK